MVKKKTENTRERNEEIYLLLKKYFKVRRFWPVKKLILAFDLLGYGKARRRPFAEAAGISDAEADRFATFFFADALEVLIRGLACATHQSRETTIRRIARKYLPKWAKENRI